ncbi:MAG: hypothetical protein ABI718_13835 [Acidobacteriota bacterium]
MAKAFPPDVLLLDYQSAIFARLERGKTNPLLTNVRSYSVPVETFQAGAIGPSPGDPELLTGLAQRIRREQGRLDQLSVLLPDSWFRLILIEPASMPDRKGEADEMVRWTLKRILPVRPEDFRMAWQVVGKTENGVRVIVAAALEKTLVAIEEAFRSVGTEVILVESTGLNIWNSIAAREEAGARERVFFYLRGGDFTTAVFRGDEPLFVRSRNIGAERSLLQEIRLSASYFSSALKMESIDRCYLAGEGFTADLASAIGEQLHAPTSKIALADFADYSNAVDVRGMEAELAACTGVFTA